jgi:ADP-ribose pyrophosphatase YjhB (NUDIX family)
MEALQNYPPNQPFYLYQQPMFSLTVSVVLIVDNGVIMVKKGDTYGFPGGIVKAGQETIQFATVRYVKEQLGIRLTKESLIPVDFRSDPSRSLEKNLVDIGFVCILDIPLDKIAHSPTVKWEDVDFENKCLINKTRFFMDHELLLERALDIVVMMKE